MSYRVEYDRSRELERAEPWSVRRIITACISCGVLILLVHLFWNDGKELLHRLLLPGDSVTTWNSVQQLTEQLRDGVPVKFAIKEFCNEILQGSY